MPPITVGDPTFPAGHHDVLESGAPARDESADALAARYQEIGRALTKANNADELRQRYRLIHLGDAMATPASRQQAFTALDAIERALPARS